MTSTQSASSTEVRSDGSDLDSRVDELLAACPPDKVAERAFLAAQFDHGLAWVSFPVGSGGLGLRPGLQRRVNDRLSQAGAPLPTDINVIAYGMAGPTIVEHGTDGQRARHLRAMFTGGEVWCQLFSEPGAGSDLASLATRAVADGDGWVVNGQKVWSTYAHRADYGLLLARTDVEVPKHRGLTYFILDMRAPGVDVKPLRQLTGEAEFNEVFLTDVRVPDDNRIGPVGEGWRVAMSTLGSERAAIGGAGRSPYADVIPRLIDVWQQRRELLRPGERFARRDQLMISWCAARALRLSEERATELQEAQQPGPEGSILKLMTARVTLAATELAVDLLGTEGSLYPSGYAMAQPDQIMRYENPQQFFLRCRSASIGGGTSEVQKNIIAERVLGLPPEPNTDGDIPWNQIRTSQAGGRARES